MHTVHPNAWEAFSPDPDVPLESRGGPQQAASTAVPDGRRAVQADKQTESHAHTPLQPTNPSVT